MDIDTTHIPSYIKNIMRILFLCAVHCGREEAKGEEGQASNSWRPPLLEVTAPVLKDEGCCIDIYKRHFCVVTWDIKKIEKLLNVVIVV